MRHIWNDDLTPDKAALIKYIDQFDGKAICLLNLNRLYWKLSDDIKYSSLNPNWKIYLIK